MHQVESSMGRLAASLTCWTSWKNIIIFKIWCKKSRLITAYYVSSKIGTSKTWNSNLRIITKILNLAFCRNSQVVNGISKMMPNRYCSQISLKISLMVWEESLKIGNYYKILNRTKMMIAYNLMGNKTWSSSPTRPKKEEPLKIKAVAKNNEFFCTIVLK